MKLYDLEKGARIKCDTSDEHGKLGDFVIFHHIDGMYSYCEIEGLPKVVHLSASTELTKSATGDYYELAEQL